jgi:hypothetical protein
MPFSFTINYHNLSHQTTMPRNGTQSDNPVDTSAGNQVHGVGEDSSIDRSQKVR